jgi:Domain of unknown function (DUF4331)
MRFLKCAGETILLITVLLFCTGADHRDAPSISYDATGDINDVYAFVNPNDTAKVVLAMTVNPFCAPGNSHTFGPDVLYQFKIDNTGDFREDLVIQATFTKAVPGILQQVTVVGPEKDKGKKSNSDKIINPDKADRVITGNTNTILTFGTGADEIKVFAGLRDDPFFFDFTAVIPFLGLNTLPTPARSPLAGGGDPRDFFGGFNVSVLAVQVPSALLTGTTGNLIRIWANTSRSKSTKRFTDKDNKEKSEFVQIDRMALPAYNTVFIPNGARGEYDLKPGTTLPNTAARQDEFNKGEPEDDLANFFNDVLATEVVLDTLNNLDRFNTVLSSDPNDTILARIQHDVLTLDVTNSAAGFEAVNGRQPDDDVIDVLLQLGSGVGAASDGIDGNDVAAGVLDLVSGLTTNATGFLPDFPFLAPPNQPNTVIPPRGGN